MAGYVPQPDQITTTAQPGFFYQRPSSKDNCTVAFIAGAAAQRSATEITTANMVVRIVNSHWNRLNFIPYSEGPSQYYKNYGLVGGPQYKKVGGVFPLLWIPTADGKEPDQVFGFSPPPMSFNPPEKQPPADPLPGVVYNPPGGDGMPPGDGDTWGGGSPTSDPNRKWWIIGGIAAAALAAGIGIYAWKKQKKGRGSAGRGSTGALRIARPRKRGGTR